MRRRTNGAFSGKIGCLSSAAGESCGGSVASPELELLSFVVSGPLLAVTVLGPLEVIVTVTLFCDGTGAPFLAGAGASAFAAFDGVTGNWGRFP
jgi:hypothetical protein